MSASIVSRVSVNTASASIINDSVVTSAFVADPSNSSIGVVDFFDTKLKGETKLIKRGSCDRSEARDGTSPPGGTKSETRLARPTTQQTKLRTHSQLRSAKAWARTSTRLSSAPGTPKFMSRKAALNFTRPPASRHTRARTRSTGPARFLTRPDRVHAARCRPSVSKGSWHPLHVASVTGWGNWRRSNNNARKR